MIAYTAVETFNSSMGETWGNFINGSHVNLKHLKEIVSIDICLCPSVIGLPIEQDKKYRVAIDNYLYDLFNDLDYMTRRIQTDKYFQIIATLHQPTLKDVNEFNDNRFSFQGYDLMEDGTQISALTDCGGAFSLAYRGEDLSECGLIPDFDKATKLRELLRKYYPYDAHATCEIWALWKMKNEYLPQISKVSGSKHITKIVPL